MCIQQRLITDPVILVVLYSTTSQMGDLVTLVGSAAWAIGDLSKLQKIFNLHDVKQERLVGSKNDEVPASWPQKGEISFEDVHLRYRPNTKQVLKKLSFTVEPGQKVGVVGRTGAGKSTLCMALTRIVELDSGKIAIDGQDVSQMDLDKLRKQLTVIPQDPTLFTGTLRYNLDPFGQQTDERLLELVSKAGLDHLL